MEHTKFTISHQSLPYRFIPDIEKPVICCGIKYRKTAALPFPIAEKYLQAPEE
jgi:hypothetical protein